MADILKQIVATKKLEVAALKKIISINQLMAQIEKKQFKQVSLASELRKKPGIIAEFKRASPSKGVINSASSVNEIITGYDKNGATAISVLTDKQYFQSQATDFSMARACTHKPILRKEFIIDEYQIYQSKAMGANVVLLIAAILTKQEIKFFINVAHRLGLEVLLELHHHSELSKLSGTEDMIGVNNRNLKTFKVDISQSIYIKKQLAKTTSVPFVSESGLSSIKEIAILLNYGFSGFLLGEYFMKQENPVQAFKDLNNKLTELS